MKYIVIVGKKGVGKDTFAQFLRSHLSDAGVRVSLRALATPIKETMIRLFDCSPDLFNDPILKESPSSHLYGRTPREVMQQFGTEFAQGMFGKMIWVDFLIRAAEESSNTCDVTIVTDVRYKHELDVFIELGADVIYIEKQVTCFDRGTKNFGLSWLKKFYCRPTHSSEIGLGQFRRVGDSLVENNGTLSDLNAKAKAWVDAIWSKPSWY